MNDIFSKRFTITGFLDGDEQRWCETGHDIESVGQGVAETLDYNGVVRVVVEVEN